MLSATNYFNISKVLVSKDKKHENNYYYHSVSVIIFDPTQSEKLPLYLWTDSNYILASFSNFNFKKSHNVFAL